MTSTEPRVGSGSGRGGGRAGPDLASSVGDTVYDRVILGGGLAGLTLALNLSQRYPVDSILVVEKESTLGGLARSHVLDQVLFDFGPHVLRDRDGRVMQRISPEVRLREYHTRPATYKFGTFFDHVIPVISRSNIDRLPEEVRRKAWAEIALNETEQRDENQSNFESYLRSRLGPTLAWEFFGQYSQKWWGLPPGELSVQLAPRGVRVGERATYSTIATDFVPPAKEYYPEEGGYASIVEAVRSRLVATAGAQVTVRQRTEASALEREGARVVGVKLRDGGYVGVRKSVVSTLPLPTLGSFVGESIPLRYRAIICVSVTALRRASKKVGASWIYFPEDRPIFSRLSSPGNFSPHNEKGEHRGFCAEVPCQMGDGVWRTPDDTLVDRVVEDLRGLGYLPHDPTFHAVVHRESHAYPILDLRAAELRSEGLRRLRERATNLLPAGRTGAFNYWNSDSVLALADLAI